MKIEKKKRITVTRSLASLEADYLKFESEGKGVTKKAKFYNNVIRQYFFDIPLSQV